jgi:hypothetical protein
MRNTKKHATKSVRKPVAKRATKPVATVETPADKPTGTERKIAAIATAKTSAVATHPRDLTYLRCYYDAGVRLAPVPFSVIAAKFPRNIYYKRGTNPITDKSVNGGRLTSLGLIAFDAATNSVRFCNDQAVAQAAALSKRGFWAASLGGGECESGDGFFPNAAPSKPAKRA